MDISELARQQSSKRHPWELARARVIKSILKKHSVRAKHILDIGSGDAFVIQELGRSLKPDFFTAIDTAYTPEIINRIRTHFSNNTSFLPELPIKLSPKADCVLLLDVLEHCTDDAAVLKSVSSDALVEKDSYILITVPAFQYLFSQHDHLLNHFRRYNKKQLQKLCELQGLSIVSSGYFFTSLWIARHIQLLLEKTGLLQSKKSIDNWNGSRWTTDIFSSMLLIDYHLSQLVSKLGVRLPGLSVYCLCRI